MKEQPMFKLKQSAAKEMLNDGGVVAPQTNLLELIAAKNAGSPELDLAAAFRGKPEDVGPTLRERLFGAGKTT